jgi:hypothetical protein
VTAAGRSPGTASAAKHNDDRETTPGGRPDSSNAEADAARSITYDTGLIGNFSGEVTIPM